MKTIFRYLVPAAMLAIAGTASAQNSASATAQVDADVVCPISIVNQSDLYFGTLIGGTGTAHVTATGSETYTGNINAGSHSGSHAPASFLITGESGFTYAQTRIPASGTLTVTDGAGHSATVQLDGPAVQTGTLGTLMTCDDPENFLVHGIDGHGGTIGNGGFDERNKHKDGSVAGCCGVQIYAVGGVITLNGSQPPGNYSNAYSGGTSWTEVVTYN